jgi:hypothetical protein
MTLIRNLLGTTPVSDDAPNVEKVFSTYLYDGTGSTQRIENGIDLAVASEAWSSTHYSTTFKGGHSSVYSNGRYIIGNRKLINFDSTGSISWQKEFASGAPGGTYIGDQVSANDDYVAIVGTINNTPNPDYLKVAVYNHSGTLQWESTFDVSTGTPYGRGVYIDSSNNVYASYFVGSKSSLVKYDSTGTIVWNREFINSYFDNWIHNITKSPDGSLYLFGDAKVNTNSIEPCVFKLNDSNGNVLWEKRYYTGYNDTNGTNKSGSIHATDTDLYIACSVRANRNGSYIYMPMVCKINITNGALVDHRVISTSTTDITAADRPSMAPASGGGFYIATLDNSYDDGTLVTKISSTFAEVWAVSLKGYPSFFNGSGAGITVCEFGSNVIVNNGFYEVTLPNDGTAVNGTSNGIVLSNVSLNNNHGGTGLTTASTGYAASSANSGLTLGSTAFSSTSGTEAPTEYPVPAKDESGGMVWIKNRNSSNNLSHSIYDTIRGGSKYLTTNSTANSQTTGGTPLGSEGLQSFTPTGFTIGLNNNGENVSGDNIVSWTFRKRERFFDIVTWTGDNTYPKTIPHNLGVDPGLIMVKCTSLSGTYWWVYHKDLTGPLMLNTNWPEQGNISFGNATSTSFDALDSYINANGREYIAYVFAHDPVGEDNDGMIACGSYTGVGSGGVDIDIGWEPQWILIKNATRSTEWFLQDTMRGMSHGGWRYLLPNDSSAESGDTSDKVVPTATGFTVNNNGGNGLGQSGDTVTYMAIRAPMMKEPEAGTEVFAIDNGGSGVTPAFDSNFPVDAALLRHINSSVGTSFSSRMTGTQELFTNNTAAGANSIPILYDFSKGWYDDNQRSSSYYSWMFKRAKGFFDVVAYTGTGVAHTENHSLGVVPEMIIVKNRITNGYNWGVLHKDLPNTHNLFLDSSNAAGDSGYQWDYSANTETGFYIGTSNQAYNDSGGNTYIAYLFASVEGVSKVGSYTGTGAALNIDCGFSNGARFVMIKRTDGTGDWGYFDTSRGIVAGNDSKLVLNDTAAEVTTTDHIDPYSAGFTLSGDIEFGGSGREYIFLAIA